MRFRPRYQLLAWIVFSALAFSSCKDSRCAKSTGTESTEVRNLQAFTRLNLYDRIDVELVQASTNRATITCGKNLLQYISLSQDGGALTIENRNTCNFLRSYKKRIRIRLEYTDLNTINFVGAGKVSCTDTLVQSSLAVESEGGSGDVDLLVKMDSIRFTLHTGNTNVHLRGQAWKSSFYSGGTTILDARDLVSELCLCNNSGSGDFYVNAVSYLFAEIQQQGSIFYKGQPNIDKAGSGKGELRKL